MFRHYRRQCAAYAMEIGKKILEKHCEHFNWKLQPIIEILFIDKLDIGH